MKQIELSSFKGGIYEAASPSDYTEDQWTQLKGFFLSDVNTLKSQWPCQTIGTGTGFREVIGLTAADASKWLFGIKSDLTVWYVAAPDNSATHATTQALSWNQVLLYGTATALTLENTNQHFCGEVTTRINSLSPYSPAILINQSSELTDNDTPIYIIAQNSSLITAVKPTKSLKYTVALRSISSGVATLKFTTSHTMRIGDTVTVTGVAADYNGTRTITGIGGNGDKLITFATTGGNEAQTTSTGTVTATVGAVYPGYTPALPSNVTATQNGANVDVAWTNEYEGSAPILGYTIYDGDFTQVGTVTGVATTFSYAGTANGANVIPYNNYGATPFSAIGGVAAPGSGIIPRANVSALWGGQLILGDIEYYTNPGDIDTGVSLSGVNTTRVRNGIWFSNPNEIDTFDPLAVFTVGTPESTIIGFTVVPQGLLVHTANSNKSSGIYLLRGASAGVITEEELVLNFAVELIRSQISLADGSTNPGQLMSFWPSTGTVVFLDDKSAIWHTNTRDVTQLDTYSVSLPTVYTSTDSIATWDRYIFASRGTTLIVMRELGNEGAWTQLITPGNAAARSLFTYSNSLYFIADDGSGSKVWRYNLLPSGSATAEYGQIEAVNRDLVVTTRPIGDPNLQDKQMWHRIGMRARGNSTGVLKTVESLNASPLVGGTSKLTTTLSPQPTITQRFEKVVPAHGPSTEICARITLTGYVEIEAVTIYVHGHQQRRQ